ncbi:hypothetical protein MAPG_02005 [Magnaporthiopsis poae ATCC 64411]|uniref:POPLD domain-containing protein n=1 Tax=Magnaporthiopsis poae (strain ATCC 64411 / 73-15) TaxID=644358 RepID=A0A0C4DQ67_MAGP6|nr:hypothetical protein MAPG_02005 [Magnaporthiopsis poae ATCC 64411]
MGPKQVTRPDGALQTAGKKRAADHNDNQSSSSNGAGRPNKKAKARVDRSIPVQTSAADALTADGEVNLPQFLEALHDSIGGLEAAMRLPRDLRRRTASHNPKRVPARLRARAKAEMAADNTPQKPKKKQQGVARALDKSRKARRLVLAALTETARLRASLLNAAEAQAGGGDEGSAAVGASSGKAGEPRALKAQVENLGNALAKTRELAKLLDREEPHLGDETSSRTEQINFIVSKAKKFAQISAKSKGLNELLSEMSKHGEALPTEKLGQALAKTKKLNKVIKEASKLEEQIEPLDRDGKEVCEADEILADSMQVDDEDVIMGDTDLDMPDPSPPHDGGKREKKGQLPTHIWHAKRAKMSTRDNAFFSKPTPLNMNTKTVRKMHRAYNTSAFMRDASHRGFIQLSGSADDLEVVLNSIGVRPKGATADWVRGCRVWVGIVSGAGSSGHLEDVTPARAIWNPPLIHAATAEVPSEQRQVLIEVEPETEQRVLELLQSAANPPNEKSLSVTVRSLSTELGCIDLHGPGATGKLLSVVRPHHLPDADRYESAHWRLLGALKRTQMDMLGYNICLGLSVAPPDRPPPDRTAAWCEGAGDEVEELLAAQDAWATEANPRPFALFDPARRAKALYAIRRKQNQNADKGGKDDADPIPILLVCSRPQAHGLGPGWTLICQREAVKTFWLRLASQKTGPGAARPMEVACFEETHRIHTERGVPFFPVDFPATRAGLTWELKERERLRNEWERRPKGKRTSWKSLDLRPQGCRDGSGHKGEHGDPFACDWEHMFALSSKPVKDGHIENKGAGMGKKKHQDEEQLDPPALDVENHPLMGSITNVRPPSVRDYIVAAARGLQENAPQPTAVPEFGLVTVQITMLGGGVPNPRARVYTLPDSKRMENKALREAWLSEFESLRSAGKTGRRQSLNYKNRRFPPLLGLKERKQILAASLFGGTDAIEAAGEQQSERPATPLAVLEADLVGFVTSGGYNLATGRGQAVAHLSAARVVALGSVAAVANEGNGSWHRCVVRNVGETLCRPAVWKLVEEHRGVD